MATDDPAARWPHYREDDFILRDFVFTSGEVLPALRLHYRTMGLPRRDASVRGLTDARSYHDYRELLDKESGVDAVIIATPDHWHAPATILACSAGKHVYVEKPASHNAREGELEEYLSMVVRARRAIEASWTRH